MKTIRMNMGTDVIKKGIREILEEDTTAPRTQEEHDHQIQQTVDKLWLLITKICFETNRMTRAECRGAINVSDYVIIQRYRIALAEILRLIIKLDAPDNCLIETEMKRIAEEALKNDR